MPCARDAPVRDADARNADVLHQRAEEAREGAWSKCAFWQGPGWLLRRVHVAPAHGVLFDDVDLKLAEAPAAAVTAVTGNESATM